MGVQDDTEKVLRALHVMLAKGEQYPNCLLYTSDAADE